jgi:hypothetical protein
MTRAENDFPQLGSRFASGAIAQASQPAGPIAWPSGHHVRLSLGRGVALLLLLLLLLDQPTAKRAFR